MIRNLFAPLAMKVAGGLILALAIFAAVQSSRLGSAKSALETKRNELATESANHAVTRQSVATLEAEMRRLVQEGELRRARLTEAMKQVEQDTAPLREAADRIAREGLGSDYARQLEEAGL